GRRLVDGRREVSAPGCEEDNHRVAERVRRDEVGEAVVVQVRAGDVGRVTNYGKYGWRRERSARLATIDQYLGIDPARRYGNVHRPTAVEVGGPRRRWEGARRIVGFRAEAAGAVVEDGAEGARSGIGGDHVGRAVAVEVGDYEAQRRAVERNRRQRRSVAEA